MHKWFVYKDFNECSIAAAEFLAAKINDAVKLNDICNVILPGGNTPVKCLQTLAQLDLPWQHIHWYLGDERCYPAGHAERNDVMLQKTLWSKIPFANIYPIPTELGVSEAVEIYMELINTVDSFDIAFLGLGEDGHTASLFPNHTVNEMESVAAVYDSPKLPKERVTLTARTLAKANCRMVLAAGEGKSDIIKKIKEDFPLPINVIGDINWFVDEAAYTKD